MRASAALLALLGAICAAIIGLPSATPRPERDAVLRPIMAQLFANPERFAGRTIEVYGLVVESGRNAFLLQDVSQRPLRVLGSAKVGDQLTAVGTFHADALSIYLKPDRLVPTQVTGGGGCC